MAEAVSRIRVSVCAARNESDVEAVVSGGADAVGVLVLTRHKAEDAVDLDHARRLLLGVPPYVGRYAVTHAVELDELLRLVDELPIDTLQVHDNAPVSVVEEVRLRHPEVRLVKAVHVRGRVADPYSRWEGVVDGLVIDSVNVAEDRIGGTGFIHNWDLSAAIVRSVSLPVILAGGLTPENVGDAIRAVGPWAVNVNSGVEVDTRKDKERVRAFVDAAHLAADAVAV